MPPVSEARPASAPLDLSSGAPCWNCWRRTKHARGKREKRWGKAVAKDSGGVEGSLVAGIILADGFPLRFGLIDHCLAHHSWQLTRDSSWSSCQCHLSHGNNGRASADGQEVALGRSQVSPAHVILGTFSLPQAAPRSGLVLVLTPTSLFPSCSSTMVSLVFLPPFLWAR